MKILGYCAMALLAIGALAILIFAAKGRRIFKYLLINAALGIAALVVVNISASFTGVHIPVNEYSALGSAVYGIPAVCALVFIGMIF